MSVLNSERVFRWQHWWCLDIFTQFTPTYVLKNSHDYANLDILTPKYVYLCYNSITSWERTSNDNGQIKSTSYSKNFPFAKQKEKL